MAFTFVVEDGTGLTTATSYVTAADALDFLYPDENRWRSFFDLNSDDQERYLSLAASYLDTRFNWFGTKTESTSALRWPRTSAYSRDGDSYDTDEIPTPLQYANAMVAALLVDGKVSFSEAAEAEADYPLKMMKIDVLEFEYQVPDVDYTPPTEHVPSEVKYILKGLGSAVDSYTSFAKIRK